MSESIQTLEGHLRSAHFPSIHLTVEGPLQIFTEITPPCQWLSISVSEVNDLSGS